MAKMVHGEMYVTVIRRWKSESFLSFFDERNERIKGGEGRIEKQNWNKGRRRSAKRRVETPAVVVNQSGNE